MEWDSRILELLTWRWLQNKGGTSFLIRKLLFLVFSKLGTFLKLLSLMLFLVTILVLFGEEFGRLARFFLWGVGGV